MKTTITLRADLVRKAERAARRLGISRNQLFAAAISEFLERRRPSKITERLNQIYSQESSKLDAVFERAQVESLKVTDWR
ncbi:MAG TPA: ribbon-helix-helix protein, CopG family [Candidatus Angelobacter sp.]|nr:ribbon-helix-helix protein, CopG family [Candidatus Angelobacter sp.]